MNVFDAAITKGFGFLYDHMGQTKHPWRMAAALVTAPTAVGTAVGAAISYLSGGNPADGAAVGAAIGGVCSGVTTAFVSLARLDRTFERNKPEAYSL